MSFDSNFQVERGFVGSRRRTVSISQYGRNELVCEHMGPDAVDAGVSLGKSPRVKGEMGWRLVGASFL